MNEIIDKERDIRVRGEIYTEIPEDQAVNVVATVTAQIGQQA